MNIYERASSIIRAIHMTLFYTGHSPQYLLAKPLSVHGNVGY
jgi:hypothetical protein